MRGYTKGEFVRRARLKHGKKYNYDKVVYVDSQTKVEITCPMCHKHKGEERVERYLKDNNIKYSAQYEIPNESLLIPNKVLRIDFYLPYINTFIEYNGGQHYFPVEMFGGQEKFEYQQKRDHVLRQYCEEHGVCLIEIPYTEFNNIEKILDKELKK